MREGSDAATGELRRVLLPVESSPGRGGILALEVYSDGLVLRWRGPRLWALGDPASRAASFALRDDIGTRYRFQGLTAGGRGEQLAHGMTTFSPAVPEAARWIEASAPTGWARFALTHA
jgi:hypothetical protein